jgi:gliding motility-associated protein GldE
LDPDPYSATLSSIFTAHPDWSTLVPMFVLLALLLAASGWISASEVAFFSLKPADLEKATITPDRRSKLEDLLEQPRPLLATILVLNNFVNVGIVILSAFISDLLFHFDANPTLGFVIEVVGITALILFFGEVMPKSAATRSPLPLALSMAGPMHTLVHLTRPVTRLLTQTSRFVEDRFQKGIKPLSVSDLSKALDLTQPGKNADETKILKGIVQFGSTSVKQIMTSRMDVMALDTKAPFTEVIELVRDSGYSRLPVYEDSLDQIKGVLYAKDLLPYLEASAGFDWVKLARPAYFVHETKKIDDLLGEFRKRRIHMALVADEFGGISGLVTLEDIIEEIVGDILDEFDEEEISFSKIDERNYVFEGKTLLKDFYRVLSLREEDFEEARGEADTLAGFILEVAGKLPARGDVIAFRDFNFTIEALERHRLKRIKVTLPA